MKGLLHSKKFRNNLYKWLFMYAGIMLLLTTVITYSRYVSEMMADDSARVAKFDAKIIQVENTGTKRPTEEIEYYFNLDVDFEVKTEVYLTLNINKQFELVGIESLDGDEVTLKSLDDNMDILGESYSVQTFSTIFPAGTKTTKKYKVVVKYNNLYCKEEPCNQDKENYSSVENKNYDILRVGYSATQLAR